MGGFRLPGFVSNGRTASGLRVVATPLGADQTQRNPLCFTTLDSSSHECRTFNELAPTLSRLHHWPKGRHGGQRAGPVRLCHRTLAGQPPGVPRC